MPDKVKVNPSLQEILDKDIAVHDELLKWAYDRDLDPEAKNTMILAVGLSAIHDRLGEMWRWDKAIDPS